MPTRLSTAARNAAADAIVDRLDAGAGPATIKIYTGTQPAGPDSTATGTLLATITLADPAYGNAGATTAGRADGTDPASVNAVATGTAGWARYADSAGVASHDVEVTVTGGGGGLELSSLSLTSGYAVDVTAFSLTVPAG